MGGAQQRAAGLPQADGARDGAATDVCAAPASGGSHSAKGSDGAAGFQGEGDTTDWRGDFAEATGIDTAGGEALDAGDCVQSLDADSFKVVLERKGGEAWGFAWHVGAHAAKRLLVAGVDPASPAGLWGALQSERGLRGIERGDELISVNSLAEHGTMRLEMSKADEVSLIFRRADAAGADSIGALRGVRHSPAKRRLAPIAPPAPAHSAQTLAEAPPVCIKNTFLHVHEAEDTDETEAFARSDPFPIAQLADYGRRSSPYTPGCLAGVNLPAHIAKMAAAPGGANLDASGTGSSWSTARSKSSSDETGDPNALAEAVAAVAAVTSLPVGGDEQTKERSRCPSVSTEWDFPTSPYLAPSDPLCPTAEVPTPTSTSSGMSPAAASAAGTSVGGRPVPRQLAARGCHIQNAPLPSPANRGSAASRAAELARAAELSPADSEGAAPGTQLPGKRPEVTQPREANETVDESAREVPAAAAAVAAASACSPSSPSAPLKVTAPTGNFRDNAPAGLALEALPSAPRAPAMTIKNTFVELVDEDDKEFDFNETCKTMPDMWHPGLLASPIAGGGACLAQSIQSIAAALDAGERPPPHETAVPSSAVPAPSLATSGAGAVEEAEDADELSGEEEGAVEVAEGADGVRRKKPTRRAGRRARHRRCHAAEARRLAEEEAKAAGGELPEGSEPPAAPAAAASVEGGAERSRGPAGEQGGSNLSAGASPAPTSEEKPEPVRRGGRPPKKSVLAAQAAAAAKVANTPDTSGLGLGNAAATVLPTSPSVVLGFGGADGASPTASASAWATAGSPGTPVPLEEGQDVLGKRVLVVGLIRQPEFNGEWGRVESYDEGLQRYVVRVLRDTGPPLLAKLRRENLLVPPTLALRFDDECKPGAIFSPEAAQISSSSPAPTAAPWLAEPAFVPCSPPPDSLSSPPPYAAATVETASPDSSMQPAHDAVTSGDSAMAVESGITSAAVASKDVKASHSTVAGREAVEKWRPTLWRSGDRPPGEADFDSSGTMSSGPKDQ